MSSGLEVSKESCSTEISMNFQLLIKTKMLKNNNFYLGFKLSNVLFIMLINVTLLTIYGILKFMSMEKFCAQLS